MHLFETPHRGEPSPHAPQCKALETSTWLLCVLFWFAALFTELNCTEGYWGIALKWFIIWLTFTRCMPFLCLWERGAEKELKACKFHVLISKLALNQRSKVNLMQQLWQDKHLFLWLLEAQVILLLSMCKRLKGPVHTWRKYRENTSLALSGKH